MENKMTLKLVNENKLSKIDELEEIATRLNSIYSNDMQDIINSISLAWQSESTNNYIKKLSSVSNDIDTSSKKIKEVICQLKDES